MHTLQLLNSGPAYNPPGCNLKDAGMIQGSSEQVPSSHASVFQSMPRHVVSRGWHPEILLKPMDSGLRRNEKQVTDLFRDSLKL
jgi:hypothetical protein